MAERERYIPGVPCWVDTGHPDPEAAAAFYSNLFGWECENVLPPEAGFGQYFVARLRGQEVAAIGSTPEGAPQQAMWNTYVWVDSADDAAAKVRDASGTVVREPFDVMDAGRMAVFFDPEGAGFCVWQAGRNRGAQIVNEPGSLNFNNLNTRDVARAKEFYGAVFGWRVLEVPGGFKAWALPVYGDHLETLNPGMREGMEQMGAPKGFEDVVASIVPMGDDQANVPPHWGVTFAVDDADAVADKAAALGGTVVAPPFDAPWVRMTVIRDPQGATFTASKYVPENRDLSTQANASVSAG
jgi:predicted enzyme related to lactoylglutathione lyase